MRTSILFASLVTIFACVAACSSESDGNGGGGRRGGGGGGGGGGVIDPSKKASELSEADAWRYCDERHRNQAGQLSEAEAKKFACDAAGIIAALTSDPQSDEEAQTKCRESAAACMSAPPEADPIEEEDVDPCADAADQAKECDATIEELNRCFADRAAAFKAFATKDLCAEIEIDSDGSFLDTEEPASCTAIASKCPSLVGGGGGDDE